jgi:hypothetical protein
LRLLPRSAPKNTKRCSNQLQRIPQIGGVRCGDLPSTERNRWITSPPGEKVIRIECLPGSTLPDELADLGYRLVPAGEGQRMLAHAITERFLIEGSTVEQVRHHAGLVTIEKYEAIGAETQGAGRGLAGVNADFPPCGSSDQPGKLTS